MNHHWESLFKKKTDKELYKIYSDVTLLNNEATFFAKKELENRNFDFANTSKYQKKWELENLIEENKAAEKSNSIGMSRTTYFMIMGIFGGLFALLSILNLLFAFEFLKDFSRQTSLIESFFFIAVGLLMMAVGLYSYRKRIKRNNYRRERMQQIIDEL